MEQQRQEEVIAQSTKAQRTTHEDEIDLYDYLKVIVKRKWLIITLFLVSVVSAGVVSSLMTEIYRGEGVLRIQLISPEEVSAIIGDLRSEELRRSILPETYYSVTSIQLDPVRGSKNKLQIIVEMQGAGDKLPKIISEFAEYINNMPFLKRLIEQKRERLLMQIAELSRSIEFPEEMLKAYSPFIRERILTFKEADPVALKRGLSKMATDKFSLEQRLENLKGVEVVRQPIIPEVPIGPNTMMNIAIAGVLGLFMGVFLAFFIEYIRKAQGRQQYLKTEP